MLPISCVNQIMHRSLSLCEGCNVTAASWKPCMSSSVNCGFNCASVTSSLLILSDIVYDLVCIGLRCVRLLFPLSTYWLTISQDKAIKKSEQGIVWLFSTLKSNFFCSACEIVVTKFLNDLRLIFGVFLHQHFLLLIGCNLRWRHISPIS